MRAQTCCQQISMQTVLHLNPADLQQPRLCIQRVKPPKAQPCKRAPKIRAQADPTTSDLFKLEIDDLNVYTADEACTPALVEASQCRPTNTVHSLLIGPFAFSCQGPCSSCLALSCVCTLDINNMHPAGLSVSA